MLMRSTTLVLLLGMLSSAASSASPMPISPESLRWIQLPAFPGVQAAWALGGEKIAGPYVLRIKLAPGARIVAHTHPDDRTTTVLQGTLYVGFGESFDESRLVAIPAGSIYVAPASQPHFLWAKDGEVLYQENGVGPSGTAPIKRP